MEGKLMEGIKRRQKKPELGARTIFKLAEEAGNSIFQVQSPPTQH
jgi:hypothetical protein